MDPLWGNAPEGISASPENDANVISQLFFYWVYPSLKAAANEELTLPTIPTKPLPSERAWFSGKRLAFRIADDVINFQTVGKSCHGKTVSLATDAMHSRGAIRWVGMLQRSATPNVVFVGVEWTTVPTTIPVETLSDGEYHGERLFTQHQHDADGHQYGTTAAPRCSFVEASKVQFVVDADPNKRSVGSVDGEKNPLLNVSPPNVMRVVHAANRSFLLLQCLPKFISDVAILMMPLIAEYFIIFLQHPDPSWSQGGLIIACVFMLNLIQNMMMNLYTQLSVRTGMIMRSSLTACVLEKAALVAKKELAHPDFNSGRIVNMISNDIEKINTFWWTAMDMWSVPLQIIVAIGLLYRLVGWCGLVGISILVITIPLDGVILKKLNGYQASLSKVMDERIRNTVEMLSGIRVVKYMGWEEQFFARIQEKRRLELDWMRKVHWCRVGSSTINYATPRLVAALTVILYSVSGHDLAPEVIFPAVALLAILRVPFMNLPTLLTNYSQYTIAMERLARFMCLDNHVVSTSVFPAATVAAETEGIAVKLENVVLFAAAAKKLDPVTGVKPPAVATTYHQVIDKPISTAQNPSIHLTIPKGKLTVIVGPTGCGKSSLLQAIGGQFGFKGTISIAPSSSGQQPVYVPQQPWIMNGTARDNIVFFRNNELTEAQIAEALSACALTQELDNMGGLNIDIGDRGVNLSGGQKARMSLARAALCSKTPSDIFLLDDIFAALDAQVCATVMKSCVCELLRNTTRILVTHQDIAVRMADVVVAMRKDGSVGFFGDAPSYRHHQQSEAAREEAEKKKKLEESRAAAATSASSSQAAAAPSSAPSATTEEQAAAVQSPAMKAASSAMEKVKKVRDNVQESSKFFTQDTFTTFNILNVDSDDDDDDILASRITGASNDVDDEDGNATELTETSNHMSTTYYLGRAETTTTQQRFLIQEGNKRRGQLASIEEKATGSVPWRAYLQHFRACGGVAVIVFVLILFGVTEAVNCSGSVWLSIWIEGSYDLTHHEYLFAYMGFIGACLVTAPLRFYFALRALRHGSFNIHNGILRSVLCAPVSFFDTTPLGRIINRFTRDIGLFDISLQLNYLGLLQCLFFSASSAIIAMVSQPIIAVVIVPCAIAYYFLLIFYNRANREVRRIVNLSTSPVMNVLNDVLNGIGTISTYKKSYVFLHRATDALDATFAAAQLQNSCNRWLGVRVELLGNVVITAVAAAGVIGKMQGFNVNNISLLSLGFTMTLSITQMLNLIVRQVAAVEADMNCVERLLFYTHQIEHEDIALMRGHRGSGNPNDDEESGNDATTGSIEHVTGIDANGKEKQRIVSRRPATAASAIDFSHVSARYRLGLPLVLLNVSLHIKAGEKIGIVGRTGSGKSTLLLALLRIIEVADGSEISIAKKNAREMLLEDVRGAFSMIPQDPVLFEGTLRSNVDPFGDCSDAMIWKALDLAGVKGRVSYDPAKLDMRVVFGGQNFSVGERQMLCLARALLKRGASCLLMDEATANVDATIDARIKATIKTAFRNHTVITIAHRLHTIVEYDRVVVMHEGRVAEVGTPADLVDKQDGLFRGLISALGAEDERTLLELIARNHSKNKRASAAAAIVAGQNENDGEADEDLDDTLDSLE